MANNKIGCSAGKTILVDPNAFDGQSSTSNISVPLEDLSISVQLTTSKKPRTVLTTNNGTTGGIVNTSTSQEGINITFIEGTEINGHKVLTTKFTDLTTSLDGNGEGENLGITDIDIDFNSSYAPMITIKFIDLRGSAIFQNEDYISNGKNKYATFFQLPYPIYSLTVKGYYGLPVTYCLHMTKFNSRFNSQTGNFEITANFIGYTYAMLSDMLLGYLKNIPYTKLGAKKYEELRDPNRGGNPNLKTLDELMEAISQIDITAQRIKADDPASIQLNKGQLKIGQLEAIESNLFILGQGVDINNGLDRYDFIIVDASKPIDAVKLKKYTTDVTDAITTYNDDYNITINKGDFTNITAKKYEGLSIRLLSLDKDPDQTLFSEEQKRIQLQTIFGKDVDSATFDKTRRDLLAWIKSNNYTFSNDKKFDVYDQRNKYAIITATINKIDTQSKDLRKTLGETLKSNVRSAIGFDPTIRNIVNVFTAAVEVYLSVLYDVSAAAVNSKERTAQLKRFKNSVDTTLDYKQNANASTGLSDNYFPWPDYNINGNTEAYLGESGVLDIPSDVNELAFIDELLKAFLIGKARSDQSQLALKEASVNWYPVSPLDTRLFTNTFPYRRIDGNTRVDVINLMLIRAMTYLGFSNKALTPDEIQAMANAEVDAVLTDIPNDKILQTLTQVTVNDFLDATGVISSFSNPTTPSEVKLIQPIGNDYYYNYIFGLDAPSADNAAIIKLIPINDSFTGIWPYPFGNNYADLRLKSDNGSLFLSNYSTTAVFDGSKLLNKEDDGAVYIKIFSKTAYYGATANPLINNTTNTSNTLDLAKLKLKPADFPADGTGVGFNQFGGTYGIQEYVNLNYGVDGLENAPYMFMFYQNANYGKNTYNKTNGIGLKRSASGSSNTSGKTSSDFDIYGPLFIVADTSNDVMQYIDGDKAVHANYGKNRELLNAYMNHGFQDASYPYINFQVQYDDATDGQNLAPVSLFGSRFYYEQTSDYARALLFLHTFPWNGLISVEEEDKLFQFTVNNTIFDKNEIINTFAHRAGFVSAPGLWAAFIGAMLWRADGSSPITDSTGRQIGGGSGTSDPILFGNGTDSFIPTFDVSTQVPTKLQYLTKRQNTSQKGKDFPNTQMTFSNESIIGAEYKGLDSMLLVMPQQAQDAFKEIFFNFVASSDINSISDWEKVKNQLEIFNGTGAQWVAAYNTTVASAYLQPQLNRMVLNTNAVRTTYNVAYMNTSNFDNYIVFTPLLKDDVFKYNYLLELKDSTSAMKTVMDLFTSEVIMANMSYKIWEGNIESVSKPSDTQLREGIFVKKSDLQMYLDTVVNKFNTNKDAFSANTKKKQKEQEIFGTDDENIIKLQLYRTCKNVYDKWIGGATDSNDVVFQGACGGRNNLDQELARKARGSKATPTLIDSFRFVTRSFKDIGDEMMINPVPVNEFLTNNPNSSFYDAVTSLLSANNFDFIALPSYINYGDPSTLETMFKPMSSADSFKQGAVGPSFVCVYVGQKSKNLDFKDSEYSNDGFDLRCDSNGNLMPGYAADFAASADTHENNVAVFAVNYSQQNQNIFKDITLDQSEFSETAESLQIVDNISKKGSETNKTLAGQNLYNVYSVRSYKTEVEMMGNAMIQPMMYFQLNNIPMFHGAYMITHVKHNLKPNFMSTHFTGVRIRKPETKLMDVSELFMSLLDSIDSSSLKQTSINNPTTNFGSPAANAAGKFTIPNTTSVADLKGKINDNVFNAFTKIKFTQYGNQ